MFVGEIIATLINEMSVLIHMTTSVTYRIVSVISDW
jgi:hypothetical protein